MEAAPAQREEAWSWPLAVAVGVIGVAAVAFRLHALGRLPGVNGDEAWYGVLATGVGRRAHAWLTPSGNPPAPFQLGLLLALSRFASPSVALLRVPAVLASLVQLALTFAVARRHLGRDVALVAALLTATLPIELVYARFGWDPSHSGVVAVAALHAALSRRARAVLALLLLAAWVHPTNVFLAPWLVAVLVFGELDWRRAARRAGVLAASAAALLLAALAVAAFVASSARAAVVLARAVDPRQWARFGLALVRLLDGDTAFTFITGVGYGAARAPIDVACAALIVIVVARGAPRLAGQPRKLGLVVGWLASLASFFVFAGPDALRPHFERYGLCLLVPTVVALAVLAVEATPDGMPRAVAVWATAAVSLALLGAFWRGYFVALETTGSLSHPTFWTGPVEPKVEALRRIQADAAGRAARLVADGYWLEQPFAYLASDTALDVRGAEHLDEEPPPAGTYLVGFPDGLVDVWARRPGSARLRWEIPGAGGRIVLRVWERPRE